MFFTHISWLQNAKEIIKHVAMIRDDLTERQFLISFFTYFCSVLLHYPVSLCSLFPLFVFLFKTPKQEASKHQEETAQHNRQSWLETTKTPWSMKQHNSLMFRYGSSSESRRLQWRLLCALLWWFPFFVMCGELKPAGIFSYCFSLDELFTLSYRSVQVKRKAHRQLICKTKSTETAPCAHW